MSWFNIIRKDISEKLNVWDIKQTIGQILFHYENSGHYQKNKVYKIDVIVQDMKDLLQDLESGDDAGLGYDFYFNTEQALREAIDGDGLKETIMEILIEDVDVESTRSHIGGGGSGYMIGGDSFKIVDIYEEPYNEMESFSFQSEEELRNA